MENKGINGRGLAHIWQSIKTLIQTSIAESREIFYVPFNFSATGFTLDGVTHAEILAAYNAGKRIIGKVYVPEAANLGAWGEFNIPMSCLQVNNVFTLAFLSGTKSVEVYIASDNSVLYDIKILQNMESRITTINSSANHTSYPTTKAVYDFVIALTDGLKYAFDSLNGVLYLYGRGFLDMQVTDIAPWKKYGEAIKSVVVFDGITKIGCRYFNELPNLQHVFLPNTVTCMDDYAFYNCNAIKSLVIPDSVNELRYYALASKGFEKMDFGRGISSLTKLCFKGCVSLHTIILRYDGVVDFQVVDATQLGCAKDGGDCYVYVPAAHVAAYQSHDEWSMYTGIRAIEDYPDICG